jgi:hypothetical protein
LLALILGNVFNSVCIAVHMTPQTGPSYIGTDIRTPKPAVASTKREDGQYGDIWITDKQEYPTAWTEKVDQKADPSQIAFPASW